MEICNWLLRGVCIVVVLLAPACASNGAQRVADDRAGDVSALIEQECEAQLLHLSSLLAALERTAPDSDPTIIECKEIYALSEELYLKKEYSLALSLIDDALSLIEKSAY